MSLNPQQKKQEKKARRDKRKSKLHEMATRFEKGRSAPNFGISEAESLQMRKQIQDLTLSHNSVVSAMESFQNLNVPDKAIEAHYMLSTVISLLVEKGIFTAEDVQRCATKVQVDDLGWTPKPEPAIAEIGDILLIKFQIFDGQTLVDDQTGSPFAYTLGSNALSCDEALVGMKAGEQRTATATFGEGFKHKDYIGKELTIVVLCTAVMLSKT